MKTIGLTLEHSFTYLVGKGHSGKAEEFKGHFIKRADEVMADYTEIFPETPQVIKLLYRKGIQLGIISTKFRYRIQNILEREDLLDYFEVIIGAEDVEKHKPDPSGLLEAIKRFNLPISHILYVGDSKTDAETALRAKVSFIAVLSGVTNKKDFKRYPVILFLKKVSEIPSILGLEKN